VAGLLAWRWAARVDLLILGSAFVVVAWVVRQGADPPALVPGLFIAFPLGVGATVLALPPDRSQREARCVWLVVAFVAIGVILTQYGIGGGVEWGGRYFAVLLPLWTAVAVGGSVERLRSAGPVPRRLLGGLLVAMVGLSSLSIVTVQRHVHGSTEELLMAMADAAGSLDSGAAAGTMPVIVSENRLLPQIAYTDFDRYAWMVGRPSALPDGFERLASMGIDEVVVVTPKVPTFEDITAGAGWSVSPYRSVGSYEVLIARAGS
jgi:hypothetical protein